MIGCAGGTPVKNLYKPRPDGCTILARSVSQDRLLPLL
jgi:hypothetical protein